MAIKIKAVRLNKRTDHCTKREGRYAGQVWNGDQLVVSVGDERNWFASAFEAKQAAKAATQ